MSKQYFTGALPDPQDNRDYKYDSIACGAAQFDWDKGYDIEKELEITIPFKDQDGSSSCVGQAWAYYTAVLNTAETHVYSDVSAKAIYSQIFLPSGGAYIRGGGSLIVDYGALLETAVSSYEGGNPPAETFMRQLDWRNDDIDKVAKILAAKEYRTIEAKDNMDFFAKAIRDNHGVVGGVYGGNNSSWGTNEPKPPTNPTWGHAIYFGKAGIDSLGKYIATPNSWGTRSKDDLHKDGWQKLREDYFNSGHMFNPWTLIDKVNKLDPEIEKLMKEYEKKVIIEGEAPGRKGIIINGKLQEITKEREAAACLYALANNGLGVTVSKDVFDIISKDGEF